MEPNTKVNIWIAGAIISICAILMVLLFVNAIIQEKGREYQDEVGLAPMCKTCHKVKIWKYAH